MYNKDMDDFKTGIFVVNADSQTQNVRYYVVPDESGIDLFVASWDCCLPGALVTIFQLKKHFPHISGCISNGEITSFSIPKGPNTFFEDGAEYILTGIAEAEGLKVPDNILAAARHEKLRATDSKAYDRSIELE